MLLDDHFHLNSVIVDMKTTKPVNKSKADTKNRKPSIDFVKFLELCKKNSRLSNDGIDKGGYTKIRVNLDSNKSKIIFYAKSSKKHGSILWHTVQKKNIRVSDNDSFKKLIATLPPMVK